MVELKRKLKELNVPSRKNVSVPNPADKDTGIVDQVEAIENLESKKISFWAEKEPNFLFEHIFNSCLSIKYFVHIGAPLKAFA